MLKYRLAMQKEVQPLDKSTALKYATAAAACFLTTAGIHGCADLKMQSELNKFSQTGITSTYLEYKPFMDPMTEKLPSITPSTYNPKDQIAVYQGRNNVLNFEMVLTGFGILQFGNLISYIFNLLGFREELKIDSSKRVQYTNHQLKRKRRRKFQIS